MVAVKVAVTLFVPFTTKAQPPVPVQAPVQPVKVEPAAGVAESATLVPLPMLALQVLPQLIALGLEVTVPDPVPAFSTVTGYRVALTGAAQSSLE